MEDFDSGPDLLKSSKTLNDIVNQIKCKKEIFQLQQSHISRDLENTKKKFFLDNRRYFLLEAAIVSLIVTIVALFIICKHTKLRTLASSLALQQIKEIG